MKRSMLILAFAAILLSSCFIPDNYEAEIWLHKDGSYEFFFEGELAYAPAIEKIFDGEFEAKDMDDMFEIEDDLNQADGFMEAEYLDNGKFRVEVIMPVMPGEDYYFLSEDIPVFSFKHDEDGNLVIRGMTLDEDDLESVKSFGINMKGELTVLADKGVKVKSHNALMKKKEKKKGTKYFWELDADSVVPEMIIKQ